MSKLASLPLTRVLNTLHAECSRCVKELNVTPSLKQVMTVSAAALDRLYADFHCQETGSENLY